MIVWINGPFGVEIKSGSVTPNEFTSQEIHFEDIQQ